MLNMINGLIYTSNFISDIEQNNFISLIDSMPWNLSLKRRTQHYGYRYDYTKKFIDKSLYLGPIPDFLNTTCSKLEEIYFKDKINQVIINEYLPGQGISRHVDCVPCFGPIIASISLNSSCIMEFEKQNEKKYLLLEPLSLLVLTDEARYRWMHSIPARMQDEWNGEKIARDRRISMTFRTITNPK